MTTNPISLSQENDIELTILMPCLNESETLEACIKKALQWIKHSGISAEVLIADNGSTDGSQKIAQNLGARVLAVKPRGYGSALYYGSLAAKGRYIIMGDSDDSYDFSNLDYFVLNLRQGFDLVMGNRFSGGIIPGAMPWKNRYIGNPVLTTIGRILFKCPARDFHCGLRGYSKIAFLSMDLRTTGMEFASEMIIKATLFNLKITEVPTILHKDGRSRPPHLRPWRDGWRHLRFMLLFRPKWLFIMPGILMICVSLPPYIKLLFGPIRIGSLSFDIHTMIIMSLVILIGLMTTSFGFIVKIIGMREGLLPEKSLLIRLQKKPILEIGSAAGLASIAFGVAFIVNAISSWRGINFGEISHGNLIRQISMGSLFCLSGTLAILSSIATGFLSLPTRNERTASER
jgi:glycosyltransferase involved in cell wall biosynthesis